MSDAPEEKEDTTRTEKCGHDVDHLRHQCGITCKKGEEFAEEHEERCSRWVSHLHFLGSGYKLRTVPETGRRLNRGTVGESRNGKNHPSCDVVYQLIRFHLFC